MRMLVAGRLVFALIGLALVAVPAYVIKTVVMDKVDEVTKEVGFENVPSNPTDIDASESLYRADNFGEALAALEDHAGANPALLKVGVLPYMVDFQIKDGERAKGYRYYAGNGEMGEFKVKIIGSGSIEGAQFPYETIDAGITEQIAAAVAERGGGLEVTNMSLERGLVGGELGWSINAESDERTGIVFQADADGSGLADPTHRALGQSGQGGGSASDSSTKDALSQVDCLQQAGGDVAKVQACLK